MSSTTTPAVGDRVRFIRDYPLGSGRFAKAGTIATVQRVRETYLGEKMLDFEESIPAAYVSRVEVVAPERPIVGETYRVTSDGEASGLRHYYNVGSLVKCTGHAAWYDRHKDHGEFILLNGTKRQTVRLVDLQHVVPAPEVHTFAPGDRAVVASTVFHTYGGGMRDHATFSSADRRPKVGDVVTVGSGNAATGNVTVGAWQIARESLVPAPTFVPGDRVTVLYSTYTGRSRKAGNVGTVVAMSSDVRGISRPDYAVVMDAEKWTGPWGFRERDLAPYVAPTPEPEAPAVPTFAEGDKVTILPEAFYRSGGEKVPTDKHSGSTGTITSGPDSDGDYGVEFEDAAWDYFAPECLALVAEPEAAPAPVFERGDRVRIVKNVLPRGAAGALGSSIEGKVFTVSRVGTDSEGYAFVHAGYRLAPHAFVKVEDAPAPAPETAPEVETFAKHDAVKITGPDFMGSRTYIGKTAVITGPLDRDGDHRVIIDGGTPNYFAPASLTKAVAPEAEAKPEDYALRLEVSAKASDILVKAGYTGILGSDVAALAEFLLGIEKRTA